MLQKFFSTALVAVALLVSITACKKSDDSSPATNSSTMTATVDGTAWTATTTSFKDSANIVSIVGYTGVLNAASSKAISLACPNRVGNYTLSGSAMDRIAAFTDGNTGYTTLFDSTSSGSINITAITASNVRGTFSFNCKELFGTAPKNVTNGSFNISK